MNRVVVRHTYDLQALDFYFLVIKDADSGRGHRFQKFPIFAKLLMVSCDEIHALRSDEFLERFRCPQSIDRGAVEEVPDDEDRIRFLAQDTCHDAS